MSSSLFSTQASSSSGQQGEASRTRGTQRNERGIGKGIGGNAGTQGAGVLMFEHVALNGALRVWGWEVEVLGRVGR
jgi:hypothetical protein